MKDSPDRLTPNARLQAEPMQSLSPRQKGMRQDQIQKQIQESRDQLSIPSSGTITRPLSPPPQSSSQMSEGTDPGRTSQVATCTEVQQNTRIAPSQDYSRQQNLDDFFPQHKCAGDADVKDRYFRVDLDDLASPMDSEQNTLEARECPGPLPDGSKKHRDHLNHHK